MISKEKFRELLGVKAEELSDKQIDAVRDDFYALGSLLFEWHKKHTGVRSEKVLVEGGENKCP